PPRRRLHQAAGPQHLPGGGDPRRRPQRPARPPVPEPGAASQRGNRRGILTCDLVLPTSPALPATRADPPPRGAASPRLPRDASPGKWRPSGFRRLDRYLVTTIVRLIRIPSALRVKKYTPFLSRVPSESTPAHEKT